MVTLAAKIQQRLADVVADQSIIDMSRQREAFNSADLERTDRTTAVCILVADEVKEALGDVDGADGGAVSIGTKMALVQYSAIFSGKLTEAGLEYTRDLARKLDTMRQARVDGLAPSTAAESTTRDLRLDRRFPATSFVDDDVDGIN